MQASKTHFSFTNMVSEMQIFAIWISRVTLLPKMAGAQKWPKLSNGKRITKSKDFKIIDRNTAISDKPIKQSFSP